MQQQPKNQTENIEKECLFLPQKLNSKEEIHLIQQTQQHNNVRARNKLVIAHMGLIHFIAKQLFWPPMPYEDLVQEGTLGFMRALDTFDATRGVRLATYSAYWIRAKMQVVVNNFLKEHFPPEAPKHAKGQKQARRAGTVSLDDRGAFGEPGQRCLQDVLTCHTQTTPEEDTLQNERLEAIRETLCDVLRKENDPRIYTILRYRLLSKNPETLTEVGKRLKLSREGVRLLEHKLLRMTRQHLSKTHFNLIDKDVVL
ncbi:MAG: sigma-70 family RNA polymerase sigma factor [Myxococcota bacterium]